MTQFKMEARFTPRSQIKENRMKTQPIMVHCLSILFLLALVLTACSPASTPLPPSFTDAVSGKVDIGGYELYYSCAGKGSPTVILEAGGPSESSVWDLVRVYMGASPRVCAYDRANLGKSDSAPKPRTFTDMTRDLHTLLQNVPIEGPYVLAGHSMGGMLVQLYASQYPEDVVGLVLVDSGHPDMGDRLLALLPPETANEDKSFKDWRQYGIYLSASKGREAYAVEGVDATISNEQVRAVKSLGNLPLAVVTRSPNNPVMVGGMPDLPEEINRQLMQQWQDMQTEFEGLSTHSTRFTAVRSGHGVQAEEPRLVVEAIRHVVDEYRGRIGIAPDPLAADPSRHTPVITGITERKRWESGVLVFYEDIYFTDSQGDAITVINHLVSSTVSATLTDDIIRESPEQQKQGAVLTTYIHCRKEYEGVVEYSIFDAAGNQSNPEIVSFSCPAPKPWLNPFLIGGIVLVLVGLGIWLLVRHLRSGRAAVG
jgi:pimeloyl-ACP methyl ester carboxylesterase